MDLSNLFSPIDLRRALCTVAFQEALSNISKDNVEQLASDLLATDLVATEDSVKQVAYNIFNAANHRSWSISYLVQLVKILIDNSFPWNSLHILKNLIIPTDLPNQRWYRSFLLNAITQGVVTFEEVINLMKTYPVGDSLFLLYCWFSPLIEQSDPDIFCQLTNLIHQQFPNLNSEFQFFVNRFNQLRDNDWELHKELFKTGYYKGSIQYFIRKDDVEHFRDYFSQSTVSHIDYNMRVENSLFERCDFVRHNPTLLQFAAYYGASKCFTNLLLKDIDHDIIDHEDTELADGINPNLTDDLNRTVFQYAVAGGNKSIIKICERKHFKTDGIIETSIEFQRFDLMLYFLRKYKIQLDECNGDQLSVLHYASIHNNIRVILHCLENGVDVNIRDSNDRTPLHYAAQHCTLDALLTLVAVNTIDINACDLLNRTPLHYAVKFNQHDAIRILLINSQIDLNADDHKKNTPLLMAAKYGMLQSIHFLLSQEGVDVNHQNIIGYTALHYAVEKNFLHETHLLLSYPGIDPNICEIRGWAPIHFAAFAGNCEMISLLLSFNGINVNIQTENGEYPWDIAIKNNQVDAYNLFEQQFRNK